VVLSIDKKVRGVLYAFHEDRQYRLFECRPS